MKKITQCLKSIVISAVLASTALLSPLASAIEGHEDGTVTMYTSSYSSALSICSNLNCISIQNVSSNGYVLWKVTFID